MNFETSMVIATTSEIHVFRYRWIILFNFVVISIINFMQLLQFSIISNIVAKFYEVESFFVDLTTLIIFVSFIVFFYPVSFIIEKYDSRLTVTLATGLTFTGNVLKIFASNPNSFWIILLAQLLIGVGQVQLSCLPSKIATTWFGPEEVSTASAIAVLGMQLGSALGCIQSPLVVTSKANDEIEKQFFNMFLYQAIVSGIIFVVIIIFFRSKPKLPPSQSQLNLIASDDDNTFFDNMKAMLSKKNVWFIILSLGLSNGVWNAFGVLLNSIYLNYFPNDENFVGIIGLTAIISGGCIGSIIFGLILDKTHRFKQVSFFMLLSSTVLLAITVVCMEEKSRIGTLIAVAIFGFFTAPTLIVGFEYLVEITYPIPEACSSSAFNAAYFLLSIVATLLFEALFDAIGYLYTFVVIFVVLLIATAFSLLVNEDLRRRDANLRDKNLSVNNALNENESVTQGTDIVI